jgi:hypothetical protein
MRWRGWAKRSAAGPSRLRPADCQSPGEVWSRRGDLSTVTTEQRGAESPGAPVRFGESLNLTEGLELTTA